LCILPKSLFQIKKFFHNKNKFNKLKNKKEIKGRCLKQHKSNKTDVKQVTNGQIEGRKKGNTPLRGRNL
jgi:hypothetical protein